jgi:diguanylate cyclase (GGDEF)-like protein
VGDETGTDELRGSMPPDALDAVLAAAKALLDPESLARLVVDHVRALLHVDGAALYWWDPHEAALTSLADNDPRVKPPVPVVNPNQGIIGAAFARNRPMTTDDFDVEVEDAPSWMLELGIRAGVAVPLRSEGSPRGVLVARSYSARTFSPAEIETLRVVGEQIVPTLATMGLLARAKRELNVAHSLAELMRAAAAEQDLDALMRLVTRYATRLLGADYAGLNVRTKSGRWLNRALIGTRTEPRDDVRPNDGESAHASAGHGRHPVLIDAVGADERSSPERMPLTAAESGRVVLFVPLATAQRSFGMLMLGWRTAVTVTPSQQEIALALAGFAAAALARARADDETRTSETLLRSVIKSAPVAFLAVDRDCRVTFREGIDLVRLGLDGTGVGDVLPARDGAIGALRETVLRALAGEEVVTAIASDQIALEVRFTPVRDAAGAISGAVGVASDLSERRGLEAKLAYRATHDALTELPNRELFLDRLEQALIAAQRTRDPLTVVVIDVEDFAEVNATLGPRGADQALRELAARLVRRTETVGATLARVDGDRFGWILPGLGEREAIAFIRRLAGVADEPFLIDGHVAGLRVTFGLALHGGVLASAADLVRRAIVAIQRARAEHAVFAVFDPAMERDPDALAVVTELRDAVARDALTLRYQPIVDRATGRTYAAEALVRWVHPGRGLLGPDAFVPVAERVGLIGRLTAWVLERALRDLAAWRAAGLRCRVTINLSAWDVADPVLPERFIALAQRHGADPCDVQFEITESALVADAPHAREVLRRLIATGATLALDDFGTGYSSFAYLQRVPVDTIKIDRSFVRELPGRAENRAIVGALMHLARSLGMHVVAEGVETELEAELLAAMGCPALQGHLYARPLALDDLLARLRAERDHLALRSESAG